MKNYRSLILYSAALTIIFLLPSSALAREKAQQIPGVYMEEWDTDPEEQEDLENAQATLNSLFGNGKKIAVPPQIAGGTIALPSFDSGNLEIEEITVTEELAEDAARNAQSTT
jgi:hypothetical protein